MRWTAIAVLALAATGCNRMQWDYLGADHRSSWSDGQRRVEVASSGEIEFSDDEADVQGLSEGGFLVVQESRWLSERRVEFSPGPGGGVKNSLNPLTLKLTSMARCDRPRYKGDVCAARTEAYQEVALRSIVRKPGAYQA